MCSVDVYKLYVRTLDGRCCVLRCIRAANDYLVGSVDQIAVLDCIGGVIDENGSLRFIGFVDGENF